MQCVSGMTGEGTPTTTQIFSGSTIGFYAMEPIAVGQEITISYVELVASRQERRRALLTHYFFDIDDGPETTASPDISETSTHNEENSLSSSTAALNSHTARHWTTTSVASAAALPAGQVLCRTTLEVFWRMDPADGALCALTWRYIDRNDAESGSTASTVEARGVHYGSGSGVEVLPGSGSGDSTAAEADVAGASGTERLSMLEQLLGSGLGGDKLWEQSIGDDPSDGVTPEPDDDYESELLAMSMETTGLHQLPGGTLRPKHSAAAIDQMPDDYGQPTATAAANALLDQEALTESELPEVRIWGSDSAAAALQDSGDTVVQLLHEIADAGWKNIGPRANSGGGNSATSHTEKLTDMALLQRLLACCDDLLGAGHSAKQRLALGPGHVLRLRLQSALMHAAIASADWGVATSTAEALTPVYSAIYPRYSPMLGLHWATVAKLLQFTGGRPQDAVVAAERALEILGPTHRAAATASAGGFGRPGKSSVLAQLQQVRSESALELAQMQQAGRQAQLLA